MLLWYGAGVHVIEGAFQEHTEPCLIARCYRDALPMLLGVECGSTSGAGVRSVSPREVRAAAWQSRVRRRVERGRRDTIGQWGDTARAVTVSAGAGAMGDSDVDGDGRWEVIVWGGRLRVATERAVEAMEALLGLTSGQGTCSAVCS